MRDIIIKAYRFSAMAHLGQTRRSGIAYIFHTMEVAMQIFKLEREGILVASALLHDALLQGTMTKSTILEEFGVRVARIIEEFTMLDMVVAEEGFMGDVCREAIIIFLANRYIDTTSLMWEKNKKFVVDHAMETDSIIDKIKDYRFDRTQQTLFDKLLYAHKSIKKLYELE